MTVNQFVKFIRTLFNPSFWEYLLWQWIRGIGITVASFEREQLGPSDDSLGRLQARYGLAISGRGSLHVGQGTYFRPGVAIVFAADVTSGPAGSIVIGESCLIGRRTELQVGPGHSLRFGAFSTINDNCVLIGDVWIERYCVLAYNIYASSGNHNFSVLPTWTIRDQDQWVQRHPEEFPRTSSPIHIEEDCFVGWGVFLKAGISIGRGAIIGAGTIVTRDVLPYSIHAGNPNREIGKRLEFLPPRTIHASNEQHRPYFYCGFLVKQSDLVESLPLGIIKAWTTARVVLAGGPVKALSMAGRLLGHGPLSFVISFNGSPLPSVRVDRELFDFRVAIPPDNSDILDPTSFYNEIMIVAGAADETTPREIVGTVAYGLSRVAIEL